MLSEVQVVAALVEFDERTGMDGGALCGHTLYVPTPVEQAFRGRSTNALVRVSRHGTRRLASTRDAGDQAQDNVCQNASRKRKEPPPSKESPPRGVLAGCRKAVNGPH